MALTRRSRAPRLSRWSGLFAASIACACAAVTALPERAWAGKNDEKEAKAKARTLASDGIRALGNGDFAGAAELLTQAEALFHAPPHLLYLARAQAGLGRLKEARATLQRLDADVLPPNAPAAFVQAKDEGKKDLAAIGERIPTIRYSVEPAVSGTKLTLDGEALPALSGSVEVDVGSHVLEATAPDGRTTKKTIESPEKSASEVKLVLVSQEVAPPPPPLESSDGPSGMLIGGIALMSAGAIGLGTGGAMVGLFASRRSEGDEAFSACEAKYAPQKCQGADADAVQALDDEGNLFGTLSIVAFAGGAALAGVGVALTVVGASESPSEASEEVTLVPILSPGYVGVRGRF